MEKRQDIQFLRGISFLIVFLFHLQIFGFENGFLGVDIFFVVSGFLMALLYINSNPLRFYKSRASRLLPAFFFTNFIFILIGSFILTPLEFDQIQGQVFSSVAFVNNFYFWNQASYFDKSYFNPLLNLWSLGVEIQFYLFFPLLALIWKKSKIFVSIVAITSFLLCLVMITVSPKTSFFMMPTRFWEFYLGILSAHYFLKKDFQNKNESSIALSIFCLLLVFILFVPLNPDSQSLFFGHPSFSSLAVCILTALILFFGISNNFFENILGKFFTKLGNVSYSAYLVHFPIIIFYNYSPFQGTEMGYASLYDLGIIVLLVAAATAITYSYFEKSNFLNQKTYSLTLLLSVVLVSSCYIFKEVNKINYKNDASVFEAAADRGIYRCGKLFRLLNPSKSVCYLDNFQGKQNILLLGNSHADSIKSRFLKLSKSRDIGIMFTTINPPILGDKLPIGKLTNELKQNMPETVVIHFSDIYSNKEHLKKLEIAIKEFIKKEVTIHIVPPVPTYPKNVPQSIYEAKKGLVSDINNISKQHYRETLLPFYTFITELNNKGLKIYSYNLEELFCELDYCTLVNDDLYPIYYDDNHLNTLGAAILDPIFEKIISKSL